MGRRRGRRASRSTSSASTPYSLAQYPNYEAHGLAIIALANRIFRWPARDDRARADRGHGRRHGRPRVLLPRFAARRVAVVVAALRRHSRWSGPDHRGLRGPRREPLLGASLQRRSPSRRTGSTDDAGPTRRLPRPGDPRPEPGQPARVLEPLAREGVGARRHALPDPGRRRRRTSTGRTGRSRSHAPLTCSTTPGVDVVGRPVRDRRSAATALYRARRTRFACGRRGRASTRTAGWGARELLAVRRPGRGQGHCSDRPLAPGWCGKDVRSRIADQVGPVGTRPAGQPEIAERHDVRRGGVIHSCQTEDVRAPDATPSRGAPRSRSTRPSRRRELDPSLGDPRQLGAQSGFSYDLRRPQR